MNDSISDFRQPTPGQDQPPSACCGGGPPLPNRRPRVREVSSRFMSPMVSSSSSSGDLHLTAKSPFPKHGILTPNPNESQSRQHNSQQQQQQQQRSKSAQRQRQEPEPLRCAVENIPETTTRSSFEAAPGTGINGKTMMSVQRKNRSAVKLFKENGGQISDLPQQSKTLVHGNFKSSRPDTPIVNGADRVIPSRFRLSAQNFQVQSNSGRANPSPSVSAASKLLQSSGLSSSAQSSNGNSFQECSTENCSSMAHDTHDKKSVSCPNSPLKSISDSRSSMPEVDLLPTVSTKLLSHRSCSDSNFNGCDSSKSFVSPCTRSLNLTFSSSEHSSLLNSLKPGEKSASMLSKSYANNVKMGNLCLPPVPPCAKSGMDSRKGRKVSSHQEEVHSLKMLHNHYLQWRYANARTEASMSAQKREAERTIYSLGNKISDLRNGVERKRIELGTLQRLNTLSTVLESQMPYLDEWSALDQEFSASLSGASESLLNASLQLPVNGNVHVHIRELGEALNSANSMMDKISFHVQSFMPKAEEMDILISELARVTGGERAHVAECGDLLFNTHKSQVEECSLRGHIIQRNKYSQSQEE